MAITASLLTMNCRERGSGRNHAAAVSKETKVICISAGRFFNRILPLPIVSASRPKGILVGYLARDCVMGWCRQPTGNIALPLLVVSEKRAG